MPNIGTGPNKVRIDPKAYAARITRAKKTVASMDPAVKAKLKEMYPSTPKARVAKKAAVAKKAVAKKIIK
jgi:hypothetical protein